MILVRTMVVVYFKGFPCEWFFNYSFVEYNMKCKVL